VAVALAIAVHQAARAGGLGGGGRASAVAVHQAARVVGGGGRASAATVNQRADLEPSQLLEKTDYRFFCCVFCFCFIFCLFIQNFIQIFSEPFCHVIFSNKSLQ